MEEKDEEVEEEEEKVEEEVFFQTINLYWDFYEEPGYQEELEEEVCVNDYNLRSKGPPTSTSSPKITPPSMEE